MLFEGKKKQYRIYSRCSAPQCNVNLHFTKEGSCFRKWHSAEFNKKVIFVILVIFVFRYIFYH